ncbi:hypothetical protein OIU74_001625 [Salix koriyanagi]|uniref:Uncharacterized protein n=1 Tax=Salix koriyanagi TaxID=2511006 RepID=A0A9Q0X450_9ROSI|nr:hypothetical protein OIU74_001625 [Salix koriyanagi]
MGEEVNLIEHKQLEMAEAQTPASRSASESMNDRTRSSSARVCSTGTQACCQVRPALPGRHEAKRVTFHIQIPPKLVRNTRTPPRHKPCRALG